MTNQNLIKLGKTIEKRRPDLLDRRIPVWITDDGRRLDHTSANKAGTVTIGPSNDRAPFHVIEAACLLWHLREDKHLLHFRTPAKGAGGTCRMTARRYEVVTLREFLGMDEAA